MTDPLTPRPVETEDIQVIEVDYLMTIDAQDGGVVAVFYQLKENNTVLIYNRFAPYTLAILDHVAAETQSRSEHVEQSDTEAHPE